MTDSLSHSCPTCNGTGEVSCKCRGEFHACAPPFSGPCPDCVDGYPKDRIERAAKAGAVKIMEGFTLHRHPDYGGSALEEWEIAEHLRWALPGYPCFPHRRDRP